MTTRGKKSIHGRDLMLTPRGLEVYGRALPTYDLGGQVLYVDSNATAAADVGTRITGGQSPDKPFATLEYANSVCTADKGDVIIVLSSHAETITGAGGITLDIAGVTVVGVGNGGQRPRFLMDGAATVTMLITATDVTVSNIVLAAGHADIVTGIGITGTDCTLDRVQFVENTAGENFLTPIKATGADGTADGLTIVGCKNFSLDAAALEFLEITGDLERLTLLYNVHQVDAGTASPLILSAGTKVLEYADIGWNRVQNAMTAGDLMIDNGGSTNSGMFYNNYCGNLDVTGAQAAGACTGWQFFENLMTSTYVASGALEPVADTPLT